MSLTASYSTILDARVKKIYPVVAPTVTEEYAKYSNNVTWNQLQYVMTGVTGLFLAVVATAIGLIPILSGISRTHLMGLLIMPTILYTLI